MLFEVRFILFLFVLGGSLFWLGRYFKNKSIKSRNKNFGKDAKTNPDALNDIRRAYDTLILSVDSSNVSSLGELNTDAVQMQLAKGNVTKYKNIDVHVFPEGAVLVLAEANLADHIPYAGKTEKIYSCSILAEIDEDAATLSFFGEFPNDKHHEILIKDLAKSVIAAAKK